jgi:parallel beta-helix repeat protein
MILNLSAMGRYSVFKIISQGIFSLMFFCLIIVPSHADIPTDGDWIVTSFETIENQIITLNGNLIVEKGGSITLRDVNLEIASPDDTPFGISVAPEGSLSIYNCRIFSDSSRGYSFHVGNLYKDHIPESANLVIKGSQLRGINGLILNAIESAEIEDNLFRVNVPNVNTICISLSGSQNCLIRNNEIKMNSPTSTDSMFPMIGIASGGSHFNTITGNQISNTRNGINLAGSWNNHIKNNTWIGPIGESELKTVATRWWCVCTSNYGGEAGLYLGPYSNNNIVEGNTFLLSISGIMIIQQSGNNRIAQNTAKGAGVGITLDWSSDNIIDGNEFADIFREDAIHAFAARNNVIINNTISNASGGIGLHNSDDNILKGNTISESGRGIFLQEASNNFIENNDVSSTAMPIVLSGSSGNTITKNNLVQDGLQRYDNGDSNTWEGNFWGIGVATPYSVPPHGVDQQPSSEINSVSHVEVPELDLMEYTYIPYREWIIEDEVVWQDQAVTLTEGLCVKNGGSLILRNVTLNILPEDISKLFFEYDPLTITIDTGGSLFITESKIIGPEWGPLAGFRIIANDNTNITIKNSEIHNGGLWAGDGAVSIEDGVSGAVIENNHFSRTYCAISLEGSSNAIVVNNVVTNSIFGINVIGGEGHTISGNRISKTSWKGIGVETDNISITNNIINDSWGVGIFPFHWGLMPENNSFSDVRGPSILFQSEDILTSSHGFRAFSYDSANVVAGQNITVFLRLAHTSPFYGILGFPETIYDVLNISFNSHLKINNQHIDTRQVSVALGDTTITKLSGVAPDAGTYSVMIEHADTDGSNGNGGGGGSCFISILRYGSSPN